MKIGGSYRGAVMRVVISAFCFFVISFSTCLADYGQSKDWFYSLDRGQRIRIQHLLVFTGDYRTVVDGDFGQNTYNALTSFQKHRDYPQTGVLSNDQMQILLRDGLDLANRVGFKYLNDAAAGISLGVPVKLFDPPSPAERGTRWRAFDGSIELETLMVPAEETGYQDLFKRLAKQRSGRVIDYKVQRNDFFVISGEQDGRSFFLRIMKTPVDSRGFSLSWETKHTVFMDRVAVAMSNSLDQYDGTADQQLGAAPTSPPTGSGALGKGDRIN